MGVDGKRACGIVCLRLEVPQSLAYPSDLWLCAFPDVSVCVCGVGRSALFFPPCVSSVRILGVPLSEPHRQRVSNFILGWTGIAEQWGWGGPKDEAEETVFRGALTRGEVWLGLGRW